MVFATLLLLVSWPAQARAGTALISGGDEPLAASVDCSTTLQSRVDAAAPGAVLELPACLYRETVTVRHPVVLLGTAGTEIRGSDVWTAWQPAGQGWSSTKSVPALTSAGTCRPGSDRCHQPEQVFVDGVAQDRVNADPGPGEFDLSADRHVLLGSDPAGHLVEVSTRDRWLQVSASGVTVDGLTFRHAANGPQAEEAALRVSGDVDRFVLTASHLFEAHGTLLGIVGGTGHRVRDSELASAGQQGFGFAGTGDTELRNTKIHDNNLAMFDPQWEAGAGKASRVRGLALDGNVVDRNGGPGLWCDIDCRAVTINGNRIDENEGPGILYEISTDATIADNVVTESGWGNASWGWGGGIVVSSSGSVEVTGNRLAWNADGISVISQGRSDRPEGSGTRITIDDNIVLSAPQPSDTEQAYLLAWLQDWAGPLYLPESGNQGLDNRYWSTEPESSADRFHWTAGLSSLDTFRETPGGAGDRYLSSEEYAALVSDASLPPRAETHQVTPTILARGRWMLVIVAGLGALMVGLALIAFVLVRRRRSRGPHA